VHQQGWPKAPHVLSNQLRRLAPNLRAMGIAIELDVRLGGRDRQRVIGIQRGEHASVRTVHAHDDADAEATEASTATAQASAGGTPAAWADGADAADEDGRSFVGDAEDDPEGA